MSRIISEELVANLTGCILNAVHPKHPCGEVNNLLDQLNKLPRLPEPENPAPEGNKE